MRSRKEGIRMSLQERLLARFLRYAAVTTQSKAGSKTIPSTPGQWELAHMLAGDIEQLGVLDVSVDEHAVVIGRLPARLPEGHAPVPAVGWVTHMDTVTPSPPTSENAWITSSRRWNPSESSRRILPCAVVRTVPSSRPREFPRPIISPGRTISTPAVSLCPWAR